jgi:putative flavoprotein involved in K+ transport
VVRYLTRYEEQYNLPVHHGVRATAVRRGTPGGGQGFAIIWCTGFRPALNHLAPLQLSRTAGQLHMLGTQVVGEPRLHLLGYGDWTGPASATLIGVGRTARAAVHDITESLATAPS